ncbi:MAG: CoA-binding protein [Chloroflexi bacterium]|nr:CoA-binding protein [Chloroflexota bacterium]
MSLSWRDDDYAQILRESKNVAVVGLSNDRFRASYGVARYLQQHGFRLIPVNPNETEVLGEPAFADLDAVPEAIDIVDVFRRPDFVPAVLRQAIEKRARTIWLQPGTGSLAVAEQARAAGLKVVLNRCMATELRRLGDLVAIE